MISWWGSHLWGGDWGCAPRWRQSSETRETSHPTFRSRRGPAESSRKTCIQRDRQYMWPDGQMGNLQKFNVHGWICWRLRHVLRQQIIYTKVCLAFTGRGTSGWGANKDKEKKQKACKIDQIYLTTNASIMHFKQPEGKTQNARWQCKVVVLALFV